MPDLDRIKALAFMTDYQKYLKHYTVVSDPEKADVQVRVTLSSWGYTKEWHEPEEYIEDEPSLRWIKRQKIDHYRSRAPGKAGVFSGRRFFLR